MITYRATPSVPFKRKRTFTGILFLPAQADDLSLLMGVLFEIFLRPLAWHVIFAKDLGRQIESTSILVGGAGGYI